MSKRCASKKRASGFTRWLVRRRNEHTVIGHLAFDVYHDPDWPLKAKCYYEFHSYLRDIGGCNGAIESLKKAWSEYKPNDPQLSRIDHFSWCLEFYRDIANGDFELFDYVKLGNMFPRASSEKIYIYVLFEIRERKAVVKYVGRTIDPLDRLNAHTHNSKQPERAKWVSSLRRGILGPYMAILEEVDREKVKFYEEIYISCFTECERKLNQNALLNKQLIQSSVDTTLALCYNTVVQEPLIITLKAQGEVPGQNKTE